MTVASVDADADEIVRDFTLFCSKRFLPYENKVCLLAPADQRGRWLEDIVTRVSAELMKGVHVDTTGLSGIMKYAAECGARRRVVFSLDFPNEQA